MVFELKFADVGEGVHEGEVLEIYVKEGQKIKIEEQLFEIHTEKVTTDITSPVAGVIKSIKVTIGEVIHVGDILITIDTDKGETKGEIVSTESKQQEEDPSLFKPSKPFIARTRKTQVESSTEVINERVLAAPAVRRRAREQGIDLRQIRGSGPAGRILASDLSHSQVSTSSATNEFVFKGTEHRIALKGTRKTIANSMRQSKDMAAHYTYFEEVDMSSLDDLRRQLKPLMEEKGIKITYVALVMKCLIPALKKFPLLNSSLDESTNEIILKNYYNIGISVDTADGLVVPVVKNVDQKSIWQIAEDIGRLANNARTGKLKMQDISGGTFTITSIGNIGGVMATPIIKFPEVSILGLMKSKLRPVVIEKYGKPEIAIRPIMYLSLSLDHRIVDGAVGARFINELIKYMENPSLLWIDTQ
ncbi:MAG: 2-oxo acid dehydrogenase subunit E2 [Candidatus Heimdallarchaeota archaeon]|nr:2-oxo acid dehydrogenase subunit E2 [Candidatus Heimdallarchaeota archaeon]MDH5646955.1 2-oxo acid dehydrogenase subunit E2 [Candidatus Heimdallarchaeota archaeon]